jgi:hypothetical protein
MRNECSYPGCGRLAHSQGLCNGHRAQQRRGYELTPLRTVNNPRSGKSCTLSFCSRPHAGKGYCGAHYAAYREGRELTPLKKRAPRGEGHINADGYREITRNYRTTTEHRWVMEETLGLPLLPNENVHPNNGQRADNRIENLELWSTSQPSGQRVEDKTAWAIEWLRQYAPEVLK